MKIKCSTIIAIAALIAWIPATAQVVIQHAGANDPLTQGFYIHSTDEVQVGPVSDDMGFDAWKIDNTGAQTFTTPSHSM